MFREEDLRLPEVREQLNWNVLRKRREHLEKEAELERINEKQAEDYYNDMLMMFDYLNNQENIDG